MARSVSWRRICPDQVSRRIDQALEARFYILRETGPTGFLVKEDEYDKKLKVLPIICLASLLAKYFTNQITMKYFTNDLFIYFD